VLAQERRDFKAFLLWRLGRLATLRVEVSVRPVGRRRGPRNPCAACLYGSAGSRIVSPEIDGLFRHLFGLGTQIPTDIGGQPLEQCTGIPRLGVLPICRFE